MVLREEETQGKFVGQQQQQQRRDSSSSSGGGGGGRELLSFLKSVDLESHFQSLHKEKFTVKIMVCCFSSRLSESPPCCCFLAHDYLID